MLNIIEIMKLLPHRYPMLLVDRVESLELDKSIVATKAVTINEGFFQGHFPGRPIMPGVLIVEAMAQCGAVLFLRDLPDREKKLFLFGGVDKARFRRPVVPGDQLILECEVLQKRASTVKLRGTAKVGDVIVAEAEMLSVMTDRPE
jgi:beta-hydroxyacyl-ACP dehydratase FabZ